MLKGCNMLHAPDVVPLHSRPCSMAAKPAPKSTLALGAIGTGLRPLRLHDDRREGMDFLVQEGQEVFIISGDFLTRFQV